MRKTYRCRVQNRLALLATNHMWDIALLENFTDKLRHTSRHKDYLNLGCGSLENFAQLSLAYQLAVPVLRLEQQVATLSLAPQLHRRVGLVKPMAANVQHARPLADHVDEFVLGCDRLAKTNLLIRLFDRLNNRLFFLLELEWD